MYRLLLIALALLPILAACGRANTPVPTTTAVPSPSPVPPLAKPALIKEIQVETQTGTAYTLDWSTDGQTLAVASGFEIMLIANDLGEIYAVLKPDGGALAVTWNPGQTQFATVNGFRNPAVKIWDLDRAGSELTLVHEIRTGSDQYGVFWSPDGKMLATLADDDKSIFQIWDAATGEELHNHELAFANPLRTLNWSTDSSTLYAAGESRGQNFIFGLDVTDGSVREVAKFPVTEAAVFSFSPDAQKLAVASERGLVQILDLASGQLLTGFESVDQPVDLGWNPDGSTLAILGYKTQLQLWDVSE